MSEERFEQWVREQADDYNRPPADVPREEMWTAIEWSRRIRPAFRANPVWRGAWFPRAAAALLLIGAGVALGYSLRGAGSGAPLVATADPGDTDSAMTGTAYEIASVQHFTAAEALLTSFRPEASAESEQAMRRWARDLLASTRLLMDSPAGADAVRRQLLEDLEYVLAQIVLLPPNAPSADRALVEQSIGREQVLSRIRSSIPAGFPSGN